MVDLDPLLLVIKERVRLGKREKYISVVRGVRQKEILRITVIKDGIRLFFTEKLTTEEKAEKLIKFVKKEGQIIINISIPK